MDDDEIERLVKGECLHGYKDIKECFACVLSRYSILMLRRALARQSGTN